jgi:hypothetical protein
MLSKYLLFSFCLLAVSALLISSSAIASSYISVDDETYEILFRLEAEGVIQSGLLTTRPLGRKEAVRLFLEAEKNNEISSLFIQSLIKSLKEKLRDDLGEKKFIKPLDSVYAKYLYADSDIQKLYYNNDGDHYDKGSNLRAGFSSRTYLDWFSLHINPELRYSEDDTDLVIKRGYGVLSFSGLDLQIGKDSQWWGPGYHGSLLLSNNSDPMTMIRLTNPQPVLLPWIFKYLGPFRFTFFTTKLEKERSDVPEPYLWGMRLNFKPHPYIEIGLQRTALLGGEGRSEDLETWWKSLTGRSENVSGSEAGDQMAGFDLKLTLPFRLQPLQLYLEAAGEDEAGGIPSRWAYLTGIYLPRLFNYDRIDLRAEYATNHIAGHPNYWYNHHIYTDGYTYKGRIIGHHMGTDSKDFFVEASYLIPEKHGKVSISYDREEHNLSETTRNPYFSGILSPTLMPHFRKKDEVAISAYFELMKGLELKASYGYGSFKNLGNISGEEKNINIITGMIEYKF